MSSRNCIMFNGNWQTKAVRKVFLDKDVKGDKTGLKKESHGHSRKHCQRKRTFICYSYGQSYLNASWNLHQTNNFIVVRL